MKAKELLNTIIVHGLDNQTLGMCRFEFDADIEFQFGDVDSASGIELGVDYLYYWPGGQEENVFRYADAQLSVVYHDKSIDWIYLMKIE